MAGNYASALEAAGAEILLFEQFGSYQGDWWAKVVHNGSATWIHGSYGSCSGCDAFEFEFGWSDTGKCEGHKWEDAPDDCIDCSKAQLLFLEHLSLFGKKYLDDDNFTQEEAEKKCSENLEWDSDAQEMLDFIQDNAL